MHRLTDQMDHNLSKRETYVSYILNDIDTDIYIVSLKYNTKCNNLLPSIINPGTADSFRAVLLNFTTLLLYDIVGNLMTLWFVNEKEVCG